MGAQQSVNLSCVVDRLTHAPGENVKGSVFVQVNGEEPLSKFEGVTVTLAGVECIRIPETGEIIPGSRKITITQDIVHFEDGKISKGEYEFPFSLALPFETVTNNKKSSSQPKYVSSLPALIHSESEESSSEDDVSTVSGPTQESLAAPDNNQKQIIFQVKASLKRKSGVPITVDTDFRCKAHSAGDIMVQ